MAVCTFFGFWDINFSSPEEYGHIDHRSEQLNTMAKM